VGKRVLGVKALRISLDVMRVAGQSGA